MNITSPSSSLVQTNFVLEDWGTNLSDSSIEFSFCTCSMAMEANGSGCGCGLDLMFPRTILGVTKVVFALAEGIHLPRRFHLYKKNDDAYSTKVLVSDLPSIQLSVGCGLLQISH
ncbi:hypothetical protein Tco_0341311 [Tanacetum coccineum]